MQNLKEIYYRNFHEYALSQDRSDEAKLKAFYYLAKYIISCRPEREQCSETLLSLCMGDSELLQGIPTEKFVQYFPIRKTYDGKKYQSKDYFSTIEAIKEHGQVINNVSEFLWDYDNNLTNMYMVQKMCLLSGFRRQQTGKGLIEDFFGIQPCYIQEYNGQKVLYDSKTGKTTPLKERKKTPKWIKLVK